MVIQLLFCPFIRKPRYRVDLSLYAGRIRSFFGQYTDIRSHFAPGPQHHDISLEPCHTLDQLLRRLGQHFIKEFFAPRHILHFLSSKNTYPQVPCLANTFKNIFPLIYAAVEKPSSTHTIPN